MDIQESKLDYTCNRYNYYLFHVEMSDFHTEYISSLDGTERGCGDDIMRYLSDLSVQYPIMKDWMQHPEEAIIEMTRIGNLQAIKGMECICECITPDLWQVIANIASLYNHMDIITWVNSNYNINWQTVAFIARDEGNEEIASYADGYDTVIEADWSDEYDEFPLNLSGPVGEPIEDKGEFIFDWRLQDYQEEFLPEEPNIVDTGEESWEEPDNFTPFKGIGYGFRDERLDVEQVLRSEFEDDEDEDRIANMTEDVIPV